MSTYLSDFAELLIALGRTGITLAPHPTRPDGIRHRPSRMPFELAAGVRWHRESLCRLLADGFAPESCVDAEYVFHERMAIAQERGMGIERGSSGWMIAVGESMKTSLQLRDMLYNKETISHRAFVVGKFVTNVIVSLT
jgi:hypothetical protein